MTKKFVYAIAFLLPSLAWAEDDYDAWKKRQDFGELISPSHASQESDAQSRPFEEESPAEAFLNEGELTHLGAMELLAPRNAVGGTLGFRSIGPDLFFELRPEIDLNIKQFSLSLAPPLRFGIYNDALRQSGVSKTGLLPFNDFIKPRYEDWNTAQDFLRILRYLKWGKPHETFYFALSNQHPVTLGNGDLMRRYQPNLDYDTYNLLAQLNLHLDFADLEAIVGPFPVPRLVGGQVRAKPFWLFSDEFLSQWAFSLGYLADLKAPLTLKRTQDAEGKSQLLLDADGSLDASVGIVQGVHAGSDLDVVRTDNLVLNSYVDYAHLFFPANEKGSRFSAGGLATGFLLKAALGVKEKNEDDLASLAWNNFRVRLEGRAFMPAYLPGYFNTLYEVQRYQFGSGVGEQRADLPTKVDFLRSRQKESWRLGYMAEFSYGLADYFALTATLEDAYSLAPSQADFAARMIGLQAETVGISFMQMVVGYQIFNFAKWQDLIKLDNQNGLFYAAARFKLLKFLYLNASAKRTFYVQGAQKLKNADNQARYSMLGFKNDWSFAIDLFLGLTF